MTPAGTSGYQAVVAGATATTSQAVVAPAVTLTAPAATDTLVDPRLDGVTTPRVPGVSVQLQVLESGAWRTVQTRTTGTGGAYALTLAHGRGEVRPVTVRTVVVLPSGAVVASPSRVVSRTAVLDARVRSVTLADVSKTYRSGCPVGPANLRRIDMNHWGFDGRIHRGHLIVRDTHVTSILAAFTEGFRTGFPIREMRDPSVYGGGDAISMAHDNTYAFSCWLMVGSTRTLSKHSYGVAVDINPVENPYRSTTGTWLPAAGAPYAVRTPYRPGMLTADTPLTRGLVGSGSTWLAGKDWQHFQR